MFTGIVENLASVRRITADGPGRLLSIESPWGSGEVAIGDSVAINGVCLTVVQRDDHSLSFQAGPETLDRTNLGELRPGDRVNLERALLPTTRLGGHFVQGHVDGVARVDERRHEQDWVWLEFTTDPALTDPMVSKGSVAVDGVSLTLVTVSAGRFSVMLIPHTLANTTLGFREVGSTVNLETDILGKYVLKAVRDLHAQS
jgi:riboflavin synthase